ncbi:hypothetical protein KSF78_0008843 [Schistosoma japonicum]|nr:hypothetical protein KSF78_0008843 [Schistosoma japonicum]
MHLSYIYSRNNLTHITVIPTHVNNMSEPKFHHHHHHHHYHINKYLSIINDRINLITIADRRRKGKGQSIGNSSTTELKNRNPGKRLTHIH